MFMITHYAACYISRAEMILRNKNGQWIKYQQYIRVRTSCVVAKNRDKLQRRESLRFSSTNLPAD
jgi:hypothetical protein